MHRLRLAFDILLVAWSRFLLHDAWALASHIALSLLTAFFPFIIFVTALASFIGSGSLADTATDLILESWPQEIGEPIANEVHKVLTGQRSDIFTIGLALSLYFASSGVESLRVGLNRGYGLRETRPWWLTRLESILFVLGGAVVMLSFALLVVLGPLLWRTILTYLPGLRSIGWIVDFLRFGLATLLSVAGLFVAHKFIPSGTRRFASVVPGVVVTFVLWIIGGIIFGWYLDSFPGAYASTYGGVATSMIALIFLYTLAAIFLFGGELNGTLITSEKGGLESLKSEIAYESASKTLSA